MGLVLHVNCEGEPFHREAILLSKTSVRICGALRAEFLEKIALERVALKIKRGQPKSCPLEYVKVIRR